MGNAGHRGNVGNAGHRGNVGNAGHRGNVGNAGHRGNVGNAGHRGNVGNAGHRGIMLVMQVMLLITMLVILMLVTDVNNLCCRSKAVDSKTSNLLIHAFIISSMDPVHTIESKYSHIPGSSWVTCMVRVKGNNYYSILHNNYNIHHIRG